MGTRQHADFRAKRTDILGTTAIRANAILYNRTAYFLFDNCVERFGVSHLFFVFSFFTEEFFKHFLLEFIKQAMAFIHIGMANILAELILDEFSNGLCDRLIGQNQAK